MAKTEQARNEKEHQVRSLQDDLDNQEVIIARLNKEKKHLQEIGQKSAEDLQVSTNFFKGGL